MHFFLLLIHLLSIRPVRLASSSTRAVFPAPVTPSKNVGAPIENARLSVCRFFLVVSVRTRLFLLVKLDDESEVEDFGSKTPQRLHVNGHKSRSSSVFSGEALVLS